MGALEFTDGVTVQVAVVAGVTSRCPAPSLDIRWPLAGDFVLRLEPNVLLSIPKNRVRGRDPTQWKAVDIRQAWRLWWQATPWILNKEKRKRCPVIYWATELEDDGCKARRQANKPCVWSEVSSKCVHCGRIKETTEKKC